MECESGHEAHRCVGSGFSWGSWLLGWGGWWGGRRRAHKGGGAVAMAAGTAGAQSAGTWRSGHGRGLTWGKNRGRVMKKAGPCPGGSTRKKVSRQRMGDVGNGEKLWALLHSMGAHHALGCLWASLVPHLCLRLALGDPLSCPLQSS